MGRPEAKRLAFREWDPFDEALALLGAAWGFGVVEGEVEGEDWAGEELVEIGGPRAQADLMTGGAADGGFDEGALLI